MDRVDSDKAVNLEVKVWKEFENILMKTQGKKVEMKYVERFQFYEQAKKAYAIILTGLVLLLAHP
jgi:L-fucose mutarotase